MDAMEIWDRFRTVAAIVLIGCAALYLLRCALAGDVVSPDEFARFLLGLFGYVVR